MKEGHQRKLENALNKHVDGDVHFDPMHRTVYSVDASIYEIEPIGIVIPKTKQAIIDTVSIAREFNVPIIPRGAATGIAGGCIGKGIVIDCSKYLNEILEINYDKKYAICQPGVVQDTLNATLAPKGFRLGPDTSTGNRATIGGMTANNSAGARSLYYGSMVDHVEGIELLLASGELIHFAPISIEKWTEESQKNSTKGFLYQEALRLKNSYGNEIKKRFPNLPRRVSGYNLNALLDPSEFNYSKLIVGSEGSLGLATEIQVKIAPIPKTVGLCIVHFRDLLLGLDSIETMLQFKPISLEMIDYRIIEMGIKSPSMKGKLDWLYDAPQAVFIVEFEGEHVIDVLKKLNVFASAMKDARIGYAHVNITDPILMSHVWDVRKSGLGLLLSKRSYSRAIGFLEDLSIPPKELGTFMQHFIAYLQRKGKEAGIYGHVGAGCVHIRPYINLHDQNDLHLMKQMMLDISDLVLDHHGALSGEHGDGLVRSWLNKKMFGEQLYQAFVDLKTAFDPDNRMNPGKVVHGPDLFNNLRIDPDTEIKEIKTFLDFSKEGGFSLAADLCNGNGLCRKSEKTMCPSFQVTHDEYDTTRARAQALRSIINSRTPISSFTSQPLYDVLELCIQCKGCKTECPSEVDMAKMKTEFLFQYHKKNRPPLRDFLFSHIGQINKIAALPRLFNFLSNNFVAKKLLNFIGISSNRSLPTMATERFSSWFKTHQSIEGIPVVLFNDTFNEFNEPEIGKSAVKILEALGYKVIVPEWRCCGRPAISKGYLEKAQGMAQQLMKQLISYAKAHIPIIGLEPSCILAIKDDYPGLLGYDNEELNRVISLCTTFDEFVYKHFSGAFPLKFKTLQKTIKVHGHCHQKSLVGTKPTLGALRNIPEAQVSEIDSGCCGMAGSFGYEKEHDAFSMKIGELKLFPAVRKNNEAIIVADGFSCRHQIMHGTGRKAYHLAEILAQQLE